MSDFVLSAPQPILAVRDVDIAREHYHRVLGFDGGWSWGEPPTHGGTRLGHCRLQFSKRDTMNESQLWIEVEGLDELFALHDANGANIPEPITLRPWGAREYVVRDLDGHRIRFAEAAWRGEPRREPLADLVVENRKPTVAEYERLSRAVGWAKYSQPEKTGALLDAALAGFVASLADKAIGCATVMGDRVANFVVRDVMVLPEHQSRGVGKAIMAELAAWIERAAPPASYATLICSPDRVPFYERFGFAGRESGLVGLHRWFPPKR